MALDAAEARVMGKLIRDASYMNNLWKDARSGKCIDEGRTWDVCDDVYLMNDKYTLDLTPIMGKAGRIREEENYRISWGRDCARNIVLQICLNCSATAPKTK